MGALRSSLKAMTAAVSRHPATARAFERLSTSLFYNHVAFVKGRHVAAIYEAAGGVVQDGPFGGLRLGRTIHWGHDMIAMLLGQYEQEVAAALFARDLETYSVFVDIGAANGYFAVGMALKAGLPVVAFEIDPASRSVIRANAALNGIDLDLREEATPAALEAVLGRVEGRAKGRALILVDIEGAELAVLDPAAAPNLAAADLVVENHVVEGRASVAILAERLAATHDAVPLPREGRNPFRSAHLRAIPDNEAWACLTEQRGAESGWVLFTARATR
ncbi:hypothetical protein [uncultured Methylobacterium sp.]|uniref:hypothetical protein n=1 Tax=uncultured Methylobacterium sp. TaxID=157278 RepID=UPI0035CC4849